MMRKPQLSMQKGVLIFGIVLFLVLSISLEGICGIKGPPPKNPRVIPPHSHAFGTTYGELAGEWWNWALQFPYPENPLNDPDGRYCDLGQKGKIWFLAGTWFDPPGTERYCTVPTGKAIFFPIINGNSFYPDFPLEGDVCDDPDLSPEEQVRCDVNDDVDPTDVLQCEIDGVPLQDLFRYRAESPEGGYTLSIPEGSILNQFGYDSGDRYPAVADGYWILLPPLSKGEHVIHFHGEMAEGAFILDMTYYLTVGK
jgi:hypothetical protein